MTYAEAVKQAISQTAPVMTGQLRKSARQMGWPARVTRSLRVSGTDTGFQWTGPEEAMDWEYGTVDRPPAPAIRRYMNRTQDAEKALLANVEAILIKDGVL